MLAVGSRAPEFTLPDQDGRDVSLTTLLHSGPLILYFYPADFTPGCTREACIVRDAYAEVREAGMNVAGISPSPVDRHRDFRTKYQLPFTLLSDPEHVLSSAYGVWAMKKNYGREYMGVVRSTFLVAADGTLAKVWRGVRVAGHVDEVLSAARELS